MGAEELTGYYTYRSYVNRPEPIDDFNKLRFAEAELALFIQPAGTVVGTLAFPATPGADEKAVMDVNGRVAAWSPVQLSFTSRAVGVDGGTRSMTAIAVRSTVAGALPARPLPPPEDLQIHRGSVRIHGVPR